ncbi:MAG: hypothetical protein Kow0080_11950 [Candidatus Promineifilaceae bacterium]
MRKIAAILCAGLLAFGLLVFLKGLRPLPAQAGTYDVCFSGCYYINIQDAIADVADGATITLAPETFQENLVITRTVTLVGAGKNSTVIDGSGSVSFEPAVSNVGVLTLTNMTLTGGNSDAGGGGLLNDGTAFLQNVVVTNNRASASSSGGGIENIGTLVIENSEITNNSVNGGDGGGIDNLGVLTMTQVVIRGNQATLNDSFGGGLSHLGTWLMADYITVTENSAGYGGGAIFDIFGASGVGYVQNSTIMSNSARFEGAGLNIFFGEVFISRTLIYGNTSQQSGGGVANSGDLVLAESAVFSNTAVSKNGGGVFNSVALTMTNTTLSGNLADRGAGLYNGSTTFTATAVLNNVTIYNNISAQPGVAVTNDSASNDVVQVENSVMAGSHGFANCAGAITSAGYNLSDDGSCGLVAAGDVANTNPQLKPLQNDGGTMTHAPLLLSPLLDAGNNASCTAVDQRGSPRPAGTACDIGAVELTVSHLYLPVVLK